MGPPSDPVERRRERRPVERTTNSAARMSGAPGERGRRRAALAGVAIAVVAVEAAVRLAAVAVARRATARRVGAVPRAARRGPEAHVAARAAGRRFVAGEAEEERRARDGVGAVRR